MRNIKDIGDRLFKAADESKAGRTVLSAVSHRDKKIGNHIDFRLVHPDGEVSWSSKRGLPKDGKIHTWFESSAHSPEHLYFDESNLPEERTHLGHHVISFTPTEHGTHRLVVHQGDFAGDYELKHSTGNQWLIKHIIKEKTADFLNPITLGVMQRFGIVSPQPETYGPLTGYPDMSKPEAPESLSSKVIGALGAAGKTFSLAAIAGVGFGIGKRLTDRKKVAEDVGMEPDGVPAPDTNETPFSPAFPASKKPITFRDNVPMGVGRNDHY